MKAKRNCKVIKVVDQRSVGNRDKITSKTYKRGLTPQAAAKLAEKMNLSYRWMWPVTTFYVLEHTQKAQDLLKAA